MKAGESIEFSYEGKRLRGTVVKLVDDQVTIKLDSGYNIVVAEDELNSIETVPAAAKKEPPEPKKAEADPNLPKITILHTGGTVASKVDYSTGAVAAKFSPEELLELFPELGKIANIRSKLVGNMMSENMRFAHWNLLAKAVEEEAARGVAGVIITHGTDILHYTAAALAFALEGCPIPVMMVGSQRSSDRPSSDAASNLVCAAKFIAENSRLAARTNAHAFCGVAVCMHESVEKDDCVVLPACRCRKMHTSRRDAFKPINDSPYARISYPGLAVERLKEYPKATDGGFKLKLFKEELKVGLVSVHPQMYAEELALYEKYDGLVLALTGLGHGPVEKSDDLTTENEAIMATITKLAAKIPVVAAPQTIFGRLDMNVYTPGRKLMQAGVLGQGADVTPETAFVKLAWLLSNFPKEAKAKYGENIRGELSTRSEERGYLD